MPIPLLRVLAATAGTAATRAGLDVLVPLYGKNALQLTVPQFATISSLRSLGLVGVLATGSLSERYGPARTLLALQICAALGIVALMSVPGELYGVAVTAAAMAVDCAFIPLNVLTALADPARRGRNNSLFRGLDVGSHIVVPPLVSGGALAGLGALVAAQLAAVGVGTAVGGATAAAAAAANRDAATQLTGFALLVLLVLAGALVVWNSLAQEAAVVPVAEKKKMEEEDDESGISAGNKRGSVLQSYVQIWSSRPLRNVILGIALFPPIDGVCRSFLPFRLTQQLGWTDQDFGWAVSLASFTALLALLCTGSVIDRFNARSCAVCAFALEVGALLLQASTGSGAVTAACHTAHLVCFKIAASLASIWIAAVCPEARLLGASLAALKFTSTAYKLALSGASAWLLHSGSADITGLYAICSAVAATAALWLYALPPAPEAAKADATAKHLDNVKRLAKKQE